MKLIGYINELSVNYFTIPIYSDGEKYYTHNINNNFKILKFDEIFIDKGFKKIYHTKKIEIGNFGYLVFIGKDGNLFYGDFKSIIDDIDFYLKETTKDDECKYIKKEVKELLILSRKIDDKLNGLEYVNNHPRDIDVYDFKVFEVYESEKSKHIDISEDVNFKVIELQDEGVVRYSLEEYLEKESQLLNRVSIKAEKIGLALDVIPKKNVKEIDLDFQSLQIFLHFFDAYMGSNINNIQSSFADKIIQDFSIFLDSKNPNDSIIESMNIEESLFMRVEERRRKMKLFNYKFEKKINDYLYIYMLTIPAYKRMGVELNIITEKYRSKKIIDDFIDTESAEEKKSDEKLIGSFKNFKL